MIINKEFHVVVVVFSLFGTVVMVAGVDKLAIQF